ACWPAPADVSDERLLFAEPLAVVVRAVARSGAGPGESAAVLGAGTLGLLALQLLRARGCRVLVVGRTEARLALAPRLAARGPARPGNARGRATPHPPLPPRVDRGGARDPPAARGDQGRRVPLGAVNADGGQRADRDL